MKVVMYKLLLLVMLIEQPIVTIELITEKLRTQKILMFQQEAVSLDHS